MLVPSIFSNNFVDDIFDDVFPFGAYNAPVADNRAAMNTDVKEFDDRYELEFELPGFKKEDIQAELKDGYLIVNAKHQDNKDEKAKMENISVKNVTMALTSVVSMSEMALLRMTSKAVLKMVS